MVPNNEEFETEMYCFNDNQIIKKVSLTRELSKAQSLWFSTLLKTKSPARILAQDLLLFVLGTGVLILHLYDFE